MKKDLSANTIETLKELEHLITLIDVEVEDFNHGKWTHSRLVVVKLRVLFEGETAILVLEYNGKVNGDIKFDMSGAEGSNQEFFDKCLAEYNVDVETMTDFIVKGCGALSAWRRYILKIHCQ